MIITKVRWPVTAALVVATAFTLGAAAQQTPVTPALHARAGGRLIIRQAMVIYGSGKPAYGPVDIVVEGGLITAIGNSAGTAGPQDAVIDATGKYVMPGIVNAHMHWHEERQPGVPQPIQY
ncbi:MAG: amidohydrolase, partial [Acidobacteria bacterium]|nr:amidohydrolase [Acidobacteriota bacterium]